MLTTLLSLRLPGDRGRRADLAPALHPLPVTSPWLCTYSPLLDPHSAVTLLPLCGCTETAPSINLPGWAPLPRSGSPAAEGASCGLPGRLAFPHPAARYLHVGKFGTAARVFLGVVRPAGASGRMEGSAGARALRGKGSGAPAGCGGSHGSPGLSLPLPLAPLTLSHRSHRAVSWSNRVSMPGAPRAAVAAAAFPALPVAKLGRPRDCPSGRPQRGGGGAWRVGGVAEAGGGGAETAEGGAGRTRRWKAASGRKVTSSASLQFTGAPLGGTEGWVSGGGRRRERGAGAVEGAGGRPG